MRLVFICIGFFLSSVYCTTSCFTDNQCPTTQNPRCVLFGSFPECQRPASWKFYPSNTVQFIGDNQLCVLKMTLNTFNSFGAIAIPNPAGSGTFRAMTASWSTRFDGSSAGQGADGYSFSWAADLPNPPYYGNPSEEGYIVPGRTPTGISFTVDTFLNSGSDIIGIGIVWRGGIIVQRAMPIPRDSTYRRTVASVDNAGLATFSFDGVSISAVIPQWTGLSNANFMFGARTGGSFDNQWITNYGMSIGGVTYPDGICGPCTSNLHCSRLPGSSTCRFISGAQQCADDDECNLYRCNSNPSASCRESNTSPTIARNFRECTCPIGFYAATTTSPTPNILLTGNAAFPGCLPIDECALYSYSSRNGNTSSCTDGLNSRTIVCLPGFSARPSNSNPSITLTANAVFQGCSDIDECGLYSRNVAQGRCDNVAINQRRITCDPGFSAQAPDIPSIILNGSDSFIGCRDINECVIYGFDGRSENTLSCVEPPGTTNRRTITCRDGYYVNNPARTAISNITLIGNAKFPGCSPIDFCVLLGPFNLPSTTVLSCVDSGLSRTITCQPGYSAVAPTTPSVLLRMYDSFRGCTIIDMCATYGSNNDPNVVSCSNTTPNRRRITCKSGFLAVGGSNSISVELTGAVPFGGCKVASPCTVFGFSNNPNNAQTCTDIDAETRRITCVDGYHAIAPSNPQITLKNNVIFRGCNRTNMCQVYGYGNNTQFTRNCTEFSPNRRQITCLDGYFAGVSPNNNIVLTGAEAFTGCKDIRECNVYGYSGRTNFTLNCTEPFINMRNISCQPGYYAVAPVTPWITINGSGSFAGCRLIDTCAAYGFNGRSGNAKSCVGGVNRRIITCNIGYYATAPLTPEIVLTGSQSFPGCFDIDECSAYYSKTIVGRVTCKQGVNVRTLTCSLGYYAIRPNNASVTLTGSAEFQGCGDINECTLYGYSGKNNSVSNCVDGVNNRTINCKNGYYAIAPSIPSITLIGKDNFQGCYDIDECKVYGTNGRFDDVVSCTNLINSRRIVCARGSYTTAVGVSNITLFGNTTFMGCNELCGDGIVLSREQCDDGNNITGDGCSSKCKIEDGYVCPPTGGACCKYNVNISSIGLFDQLACQNGWWRSKNFTTPQAVEFSNIGLTLDETRQVKMCADLTITKAIVVDGINYELGGRLTVDGGSITFINGGSISISPCPEVNTANQSLLVFTSDSSMYISVDTDDFSTVAPAITVDGCVEADGYLFLGATKIQSGSIPIIISTESCVSLDKVFKVVVGDLPGGCSSFQLSATLQAYFGEFNYKTFCTPQIVGVVLGTVLGTLAILAIVAVVVTQGAPAEDAYTAL